MHSIKYIIPKILRKTLNPAAIDNSQIDKSARCDIGCVVNTSTMGRYSYIGEFTHLLHTDMGAFCSISNYCAIGGAMHPMNWVSMSPVFNDSKGMLKSKLGGNHYDPFIRTYIGNDVWIGSHCLIKSGITIGDGAVIGMGSVVTHNVGAYEVWGGNPAKLIRKRFDDDVIAKLLRIQWWNFDNEKLSHYAQYMNSPEVFLEEYDG